MWVLLLIPKIDTGVHTFVRDGILIEVNNLPEFCIDNNLVQYKRERKRRLYEGYTMV